MTVTFYKGPGDCITHLIRLITWSPYSHAEILFSDGNTFCASGRNPKGVTILKKVHHAGQWDFIHLDVSPEEEQQVFQYAKKMVGLPFNWRGIWQHVIPILPNNSNKNAWYCTEIIIYVLHHTLKILLDLPLDSDPKDLFRELLHHPRRLEYRRDLPCAI